MRNGHIKRITDPDIQSSVLEIAGTNVSTTYVTCPADPKQTLGIKLPFLVMIIKNVRAGPQRWTGLSPRHVCWGYGLGLRFTALGFPLSFDTSREPCL